MGLGSIFLTRCWAPCKTDMIWRNRGCQEARSDRWRFKELSWADEKRNKSGGGNGLDGQGRRRRSTLIQPKDEFVGWNFLGFWIHSIKFPSAKKNSIKFPKPSDLNVILKVLGLGDKQMHTCVTFMQVQTQNEIHYYYNHISIQVLYKGSNLKWIESKLIEETKGVAFNGQRYEPETMGSSSLRKAGMIISRGGGVAKVV